MRAFHEKPNVLHIELTFLNHYVQCIITKCMFLSSTKIYEASQTNSVDPVGTVLSGSTIFAK